MQDHGVRATDGAEQKIVRIDDFRLRLVVKGAAQAIHRDLRCDIAVRMAAHAVGHHQEQCVLGVPMRDAVLLIGPLADARVLENRVFHRRLFAPLLFVPLCISA